MAESRPEWKSHEPGTFFYCNNWDFKVLESISVRETEEFIGRAFERRTAHPRFAFSMSKRDLARIGQLSSQTAQWDSRTVIPADWVDKSTRTYSDDSFEGMGHGHM